MNKILCLIAVVLVFMASDSFAFNPASITFSQTSSARTTMANLRLGVVYNALGRDGNTPIQGLPIPTPINHFMTKASVTHTFTAGTIAIEIQTDQDTKMYVGNDLTNFIMIYSGVPRAYIVK